MDQTYVARPIRRCAAAPSDQVVASFRTECIQLFAELVQIFGVPKSVGQIYGLLYASPVPLCFSDIVEALGVSKGSASQGLQLLRSLGAIVTVDEEMRDIARSSGRQCRSVDRRDYYRPELSLRQLVSGILRERVLPLSATSADRLDRLRRLAASAGTDRFYLQRARQLELWRRRLKTVLPVVDVLLSPSR
jgi:DNA-binding transcriptional ArsR family regulator